MSDNGFMCTIHYTKKCIRPKTPLLCSSTALHCPLLPIAFWAFYLQTANFKDTYSFVSAHFGIQTNEGIWSEDASWSRMIFWHAQ